MARLALRLRDVENATGLSRSTIYRHMKAGKFPKPRRTCGRTVRWLSKDIEAWLDRREPAEYPSQSQRAL